VQKGGSGDAAGARKARPQNGRVPAGTAATAAAARGKKPGVLSQSASFPARGAAAATATKKAAAAVAATPKQGKGAVANGSEAAAGLDAGFPSSLYTVWVCSVFAASVVSC